MKIILNRPITITLLTITLAFCITQSASAQQITQSQLDAVRAKSTLQPGDTDLNIVDRYIQQQFSIMMLSQTAQEISAATETLINVRNSNSAVQAARQAYSDQFADSIAAQTPQILEFATQMQDRWLAQQLRLALVIIITRTDNPILIDQLLQLTTDPAAEIRYWALTGLTQERIFDTLRNSLSDDETLQSVIGQLNAMLDNETEPLVITQIAQATRVLPQAQSAAEILIRCAQVRTVQYRNWDVSDERSDLDILNTIFDLVNEGTLEQESAQEIRLVRAAAELFSAAYDRYAMGTNYRPEVTADTPNPQPINILSEQSQTNLRAVLIEGEQGFYAITDNANFTSRFRRSLDQNDDLTPAYNFLLGSTGILSRSYNLFTEAEAALDRPIPAIPNPSPEFVQRARNLAELPDRLLDTGM
ncbi:MAG: hypothetical protein JW936_03955 [Sedimentisphaerales bacterium]|nr:hypothetical protein [Sedimentisphaerales bacterium]